MRFGRIDADIERTLLRDALGGDTAATQHLPVLFFCTALRKSRAVIFEGPHERQAIVEFVRKQLGVPARKLASVAEVEEFCRRPYIGIMDPSSSAVAVREMRDELCFTHIT